MTESKPNNSQGPPKTNGNKSPQQVISDPKDVAQLVLMQIDSVNAKKDDLTIAVKGLADTAKQLVRVYARQQGQIAKLVKRIEEMEKVKD